MSPRPFHGRRTATTPAGLALDAEDNKPGAFGRPDQQQHALVERLLIKCFAELLDGLDVLAICLGDHHARGQAGLIGGTALADFRNHHAVVGLDPTSWLGAVLYGIVALALAWLLGRFLRLAVEGLIRRDRFGLIDRTAALFIVRLGRMAVYVVAFILYAHLIPALRAMGTALLAGVSVASVVFGLAAQNTLSNVIAGIALAIYRPFAIGDRLQISTPAGPETGIVESLTLGYTSLQTADNRRIVVPKR